MRDKTKKLRSSVEVGEELGRVNNSLEKDRDGLKRLGRERPDLLVFGSTEEIQAHDEKIRTVKTRIESLEAQQTALRRRLKNLEAEEAVAAMPTHIEGVVRAFDAVQTSEATYQSAVRNLEEAVARLSAAKATVTMHRPNAVADLPAMPEELARRIRDMHRPSVRVMRS